MAESYDYTMNDTCFPYKISFTMSNSSSFNYEDAVLDEDYEFPSCTFWNTTTSEWSGDGCFVYDIVNDTVTCGCTHLTTFSISGQEVIPEANILTDLDWKLLSIYNLWHYPTVWVTCFIIFVIFMILCIVNPRSGDVRNKSIIAYQDSIYKSFLNERLDKDVLGKELQIITDHIPNADELGKGLTVQLQEDPMSMCALHLKLWKVYLRNEV